jgi:hypothetical protein
MTPPNRAIAPVDRVSRNLLSALDDRVQIAPISKQNPQFDIDAAYRVTAEIRRLREARGERVLGRKIGFTNRTIWPEYGVYAPIWGYVYDTTVHPISDRTAFDLSSMVEPRIEPEIMFGLSRAPQSDMESTLCCPALNGWLTGSRSCSPCFRGSGLRRRTPLRPSDCTGRCSLGRNTRLRLAKPASGSTPCPR